MSTRSLRAAAAVLALGAFGLSGCAAPSPAGAGGAELTQAQALVASAAASWRDKKFRRAESDYLRAMDLAARTDPPQAGAGVFKDAADYLAGLYESQQQYDLAEATWARLVSHLEKFRDRELELRSARQNLADMYERHGKPALARPLFAKIADSYYAAGNAAEAQRFERLAGLEPAAETSAASAPATQQVLRPLTPPATAQAPVPAAPAQFPVAPAPVPPAAAPAPAQTPAPPAPAATSCPQVGGGVVGFSVLTPPGDCGNPQQLVGANRQAGMDDCARTFPGSTAANFRVTDCRAEPAGQQDGRKWGAGVVGSIAYDCLRCPGGR